MHAEEMWKTTTGRGVTVAVIDSGVDDSLVDLKSQVLAGKDYSKLSGDEHTDHEGHGTSVAALIAATGARGHLNGSYGLAPGVKILPIRMRYGTEDFGKVDGGAEYSRVLTRAIRYAADSEAQVINISMGASNSPGRENVSRPALESAVKYALDKGKLLFAAVGNTGNRSNLLEYPAATPGVIGVGAINEKIQRTATSQHGPQVDVVAPGDNMIAACPGGTQVCKSGGTSDATALASASAALIWSKHPSWTNNQVLRVLINTMQGNEDGWTRNDSVGYGAVRPRVALKNPGDPGPADEYPLPDLAAAASKSPSPEASRSAGSAGDSTADHKTGSAADRTNDGAHTTLWIALGIAAAALLGAAIGFSLIRARSRRPAPEPTSLYPAPTYPPHSPSQQPYPPFGPPHGDVNGTPTDGAPRPGQHP